MGQSTWGASACHLLGCKASPPYGRFGLVVVLKLLGN